jgi:hypothetical protein
MDYLDHFYQYHQDADIIVIQHDIEFIHPEFLFHNFKKQVKCLYTVDDPHRSYELLTPNIWAYDCCAYISPSYNQSFTMDSFVNTCFGKPSHWLPLCMSVQAPYPYDHFTQDELLSYFTREKEGLIYCGAYYKTKASRLLEIMANCPRQLTASIYGNFPFLGVPFAVNALFNAGRFCRPRYLTRQSLTKLYKEAAIGVNMHLSTPAQETGNMRMYEYALYGVTQLCDSSQWSAAQTIFTHEHDILLYESMDQLYEYLHDLHNNPVFRAKLALNAYRTVTGKYSYLHQLESFGLWLTSL